MSHQYGKFVWFDPQGACIAFMKPFDEGYSRASALSKRSRHCSWMP